MLVVLDTNILVSGLLSSKGMPAHILRRYLAGEFQLCVDERILSEYREVLLRPKFRFNVDRVETLLTYIRRHSFFVIAQSSDIPFIDPKDKPFYEVAKSGGAVLVTGNLKHFPEDPIVKSVHDLF